MPHRVTHPPTPAGLKPEAIDALVQVHVNKRLELAFTVGREGHAYLNGSPQALVTELLRLARTGAVAEQAASQTPAARVGGVVRAAAAVWNVRHA